MPPRSIPLETVAAYLDTYLRIAEVPDSPQALNGLQVANSGTVTGIVAAVDATQDTIDGISGRDGPGRLLLVHHGLFWDGNQPVTGRRYRRLRSLLQHEIAVYSAHIPLDVHPEMGNNVALAEMLGMPVQGWFGQHRGVPIGVWGELTITMDDLVRRLDAGLETRSKLIPGGPDHAARVGIISGAGGSAIGEAIAAGLDTFITGEGAHHTYFDAAEGGINVIYAGHYATEILGVQRLARHLSDRFDVPWEFHRHDTGL